METDPVDDAPPTGAAPDSVDLRGVGRVAARRWWFIALVVVGAAAAGYNLTIDQALAYTARATIVVGQATEGTVVDGDDLQASERMALTYADLAVRQPILQGVIDELGLAMDWRTLAEQIQVNRVPDTPLIEISAGAASPEVATRIVEETATGLIAFSPADRARSSQVFIERRLESLREDVTRAEERIDGLETRRDAATGAQRATLDAEIAQLRDQIDAWDDTYASLLSLQGNQRWPNQLALFEPVEVEPNVGPGRELTAVIAAGLGLLLSLAIVSSLASREHRRRGRKTFGEEA